MTTATGRFTQLEPRHPPVAPRKATPEEARKAALTCARAALEQPDPAADLRFLLDILNPWGDE